MGEGVAALVAALQAAQEAVKSAAANPSTETWVLAEQAREAIRKPLEAVERSLDKDLKAKIKSLISDITQAIVLGARNVPGTATWDSHERALISVREDLLQQALQSGRPLSDSEVELRERWLTEWREHRKLGLILNGIDPEQAATMAALMSPDTESRG